MPLLNRIHYPAYDEKCKKLTEEVQIRFAGILDESGQMVAGGFKDGLTPLESDRMHLRDFFRFVSEISLRKDLDKTLGPINYLAARRDRVILVSFPFPLAKMTLLISADTMLDIEHLASHVIDVFSSEHARLAEK